MTLFRGLAAGVMLFPLIILGCVKAPNSKIAEVNIAIETAKEAKADSLARPDFEAAKEAFESAKKEIQAENKKLPFLRNYGNANLLLNSAEVYAEKAHEVAKDEQERMKAEEEKVKMENVKKKPKAKKPNKQ